MTRAVWQISGRPASRAHAEVFLRLANAFSALYPKGSEEKRLIDAMLLAVPR
jgi:putative DNA methylase